MPAPLEELAREELQELAGRRPGERLDLSERLPAAHEDEAWLTNIQFRKDSNVRLTRNRFEEWMQEAFLEGFKHQRRLTGETSLFLFELSRSNRVAPLIAAGLLSAGLGLITQAFGFAPLLAEVEATSRSRSPICVSIAGVGERNSLELAISRQAVAEWRDRQILSAAALLNRKAVDARAAFDCEVETATAAETIFNPSALANARIDALLGALLGESLPEFLGMAADELVSIDQRLADVGEALRRPDALAMPRATATSLPAPATATEDASAATDEPDHPQPSKRGLLGVPAMLAKRASSLADGAGSAADELLQDKLGLKNRLRSAAAQRVAQTWMGGAGEPKPLLAQLVSLIDETTHAARMSLS